jgi:sugar lactone lactonase YvrE
MQNFKTSYQKLKSLLKTGLLICVLMICFSVNASTTDSTTHTGNKPVLSSNNLCINTELIMYAVSPKVERIDWKHNGQLLHTSLTPALIKTVAGTGEGIEDDEFRFPTGIAVDGSGNIYVADQFNHRVQKWVPGASEGITVAGVAGQGDGADQLNYPMAVAVDAKGNLYVSDAANSRIQMFTPGSVIGVTVAGGNGRGSAARQFNMPFGICLDDAGNIYVADNYNHRIQKWTPGAAAGITVAGGNGKGNAASQLQYPSSVKIDKNGTLFIADAANDRIQAWKNGATTGITVAGGAGRGKGMGQLYFPTDIAINAAGDLFISDQTNQRIQRWTPGAKAGITVAGGNGQGNAMNQFNYPYGLFLDADDNLYVADQYNHRIQFFLNPESKTRYSFQLKATRPGIYNAAIVYRNGKTEELDPIEIHDLPSVAPIVSTELVCSGKEYQLTADTKDGKWMSNNSAIAAISEKGLLLGKQKGSALISYEIKDAFGCVNSVSTTIEVKASPVLPPVTLAPELIQQSGNSSFGAQQICAGSSLPLSTILLPGRWNSSDTNIAKITAGKIQGINAGEVVISYTAEHEGCVSESKNAFVVLAPSNAPVIQGYNKVVTGHTGQLSVGAVQGVWGSEVQQIATVDQRGNIRAERPGTTIVSFETVDQQGCKIKTTIPVTVQPEAPLVKDASYDHNAQSAFIRFDQQVMAKAGATLQFFETASPNAKPIDPLVKNTVGNYRFWVASVENGVASQRVAFAVNINQSGKSEKLEPVIMGNPSTSFFTVQLKSKQTNLPISMRIADMSGRLVEQRQSLAANSTIQFGQTYANGQYIVEWVQGTERKVVQLVKIGAGEKAASFQLLAASLK